MAYMNDPRENCIDLDNQAIWESDNRKEARWKWNSLVTDLCDMPVEEYMKNPIIEAIEGGSSSSGSIQEVLDKMDEKTDVITSAISESTKEICDAIGSGGTPTPQKQVTYYYASINNKVPYGDMTKEMFTSGSISVDSESFFSYILGDPSQEDWQLYLNGEINESELVDRSNSTYYFVIPDAYGVGNKFIILEEGISDVTNNFVEVPELDSLFDGFMVFKSYDKDHFNIDYPDETNVKITHTLKLIK